MFFPGIEEAQYRCTRGSPSLFPPFLSDGVVRGARALLPVVSEKKGTGAPVSEGEAGVEGYRRVLDHARLAVTKKRLTSSFITKSERISEAVMLGRISRNLMSCGMKPRIVADFSLSFSLSSVFLGH